MPLVIEAIRSDDAMVRGTALEIAARLPGAAATKALVEELPKLEPAAQARLLETLGIRGDRAASGVAEAFLVSKDDAVRLAAIQALGKLGDAKTVERLAQLTVSGGAASAAAFRSLAELFAPGVDEAILDGLKKGDPAMRAVLLRAAAERRSPGAPRALLEAARDPDVSVRLAALEALAAAGPPETLGSLLDLLAAPQSPAEEAAGRKAIVAVGSRIDDPAKRVAPVLSALEKAAGSKKAPFIGVLGVFGGAEALAAVRTHLRHADPVVKDAAFRALAGWPGTDALDDLLQLSGEGTDAARRAVALRGYLRLSRLVKGEAERIALYGKALRAAGTAELKKALLLSLADSSDSAALQTMQPLLQDREVQAEAAAAVLKLSRALLRGHRGAVQKALEDVLGSAKDRNLLDQANRLLEEAKKGPADPAVALRRDPARSEALKKDLAQRAPRRFRLAAYLDCGPDVEDGAPGGPRLRLITGTPHLWLESDLAAPLQKATIFHDAGAVLFEASGLNPESAYRLGFTWWDYDSNGRLESVILSTGKGERPQAVIEKAPLPWFTVRGEPPQEKVVPVPRDLYAGGSLRIAFRNEGSTNAVVSELWLWERPAAGGAEAAAGEKPLRVLLLTGDDYPGHLWKETAPVVRDALEKDPRFEVTVAEKPEVLATPALFDQDVVVLHWMNWEKPDPGPVARENLKKFVEGGKGLFLIHFACGAFQDWPEFRSLAGRSYDKTLRGHDPHGKFLVEIKAPGHPVTKGLKDFEVVDELYTCLAGDRPIQVLAAARSKVDGKDYPMAFVLEYGKGRVFHSPLGHDVRALETPAVQELFRRGAAWAGGLPPVAEGAGGKSAEKK